MKTFVFFSLVLAAVVFSRAEDDGQYRPGKYGGDDGRYHASDEGRYLAAKYGNLYGRDASYQPVYFQNYSPYQQLLTPFVGYGDRNSIDQETYASSLAAVTYRPPVAFPFSKARPAVFSATPKPIVYSASPKPLVYAATPKPFIYATPKPVPKYAPVGLYAGQQYTAERYANIVRQENTIDVNAYRYLYQTDNGITAQETGIVDPTVNGGGTRASGFYEYIGNDGIKYRVDYTADENGFRPTGAHLP